VVVGTEKNFDSLLKENKFVLAEFYAPWCGHCKNLEPEYEKAASTLKPVEGLKLVKVDATVERTLGEKYSVQGFPTLKFFADGEASDYGGGRDHDAIVAWVKKKTGAASVKLGDKASVDAFAKDSSAVMVGLFKDGDTDFIEFEKAARSVNGIPTGHTSDEDLIQLYSGAKVIMITKHDGGTEKFTGKMEAAAIKEFAVTNSLPLVIQFTQETQDKIFGEDAPKRHLLAMQSEGYTEKANLDRELASVAKEYRGQVLVISVEKTQDNEGVFNFFGVSDVTSPVIVSIDQNKGGMKKFFYDGELVHDAMKAWMADVVSGKLNPVLKSEEPPAQNDGPVKVVVGKTYKAEVVDSDKDVLVEFYAPWCGHCKALEPEYAELGKTFEKVDSVVIAKVDATANEIEDPEVQGFPTLYFYKAGAKEPVKYTGGRTAKDMEKYIRENAGIAIGAKHDKEL
jgi:protein disulfide-isomerase A1